MSRNTFSFISVLFMLLVCGVTANAQNNNTSNPVIYEREPQTAADIDKLTPQDTYSLPWESIKEDNILWKKRVWRDIRVQDTENKIFRFNAETNGKDLINILIGGVINGKYKAYSGAEDRFVTALSKEEFIGILTPEVAGSGLVFNPQKVSAYRIKEDWLFLAKEHKMVVRILGIAPVVPVTYSDGSSTEQPVFWLYYPDIRNYLAEHKVYAGVEAKDINWDQLFESRNFKSRIDKVKTDIRK